MRDQVSMGIAQHQRHSADLGPLRPCTLAIPRRRTRPSRCACIIALREGRLPSKLVIALLQRLRRLVVDLHRGQRRAARTALEGRFHR